MFESYFVDRIVTLFGGFIEVNKEDLSIGLWNGYVVLENVEIKREGLRLLRIPLSVHKGIVRRLVINVPWHRLLREPIRILIEGISITVLNDNEDIPVTEFRPYSYDPKEVRKAAEEVVKSEIKHTPPKDESPSVYAAVISRLLNRVLESVEITIARVHLRYEDHSSQSGHVALGTKIERLSFTALTPGLTVPEHFIGKQIAIQGMSVYWEKWDAFSDVGYEAAIGKQDEDAPSVKPVTERTADVSSAANIANEIDSRDVDSVDDDKSSHCFSSERCTRGNFSRIPVLESLNVLLTIRHSLEGGGGLRGLITVKTTPVRVHVAPRAIKTLLLLGNSVAGSSKETKKSSVDDLREGLPQKRPRVSTTTDDVDDVDASRVRVANYVRYRVGVFISELSLDFYEDSPNELSSISTVTFFGALLTCQLRDGRADVAGSLQSMEVLDHFVSYGDDFDHILSTSSPATLLAPKRNRAPSGSRNKQSKRRHRTSGMGADLNADMAASGTGPDSLSSRSRRRRSVSVESNSSSRANTRHTSNPVHADNDNDDDFDDDDDDDSGGGRGARWRSASKPKHRGVVVGGVVGDDEDDDDDDGAIGGVTGSYGVGGDSIDDDDDNDDDDHDDDGSVDIFYDATESAFGSPATGPSSGPSARVPRGTNVDLTLDDSSDDEDVRSWGSRPIADGTELTDDEDGIAVSRADADGYELWGTEYPVISACAAFRLGKVNDTRVPERSTGAMQDGCEETIGPKALASRLGAGNASDSIDVPNPWVVGSITYVARDHGSFTGTDVAVDGEFGPLKLNWNRETFMALMLAMDGISSNPDDDSPSSPSSLPTLGLESEYSLMSFSGRFHDATLVLQEDGVPLARVDVSETEIKLSLQACGSYGVELELTDYTVTDPESDVSCFLPRSSQYFDRRAQKLTYIYRTYTPGTPSFPGYELYYAANIRALRLLYVQSFMNKLDRWYADGWLRRRSIRPRPMSDPVVSRSGISMCDTVILFPSATTPPMGPIRTQFAVVDPLGIEHGVTDAILVSLKSLKIGNQISHMTPSELVGEWGERLAVNVRPSNGTEPMKKFIETIRQLVFEASGGINVNETTNFGESSESSRNISFGFNSTGGSSREFPQEGVARFLGDENMEFGDKGFLVANTPGKCVNSFGGGNTWHVVLDRTSVRVLNLCVSAIQGGVRLRILPSLFITAEFEDAHHVAPPIPGHPILLKEAYATWHISRTSVSPLQVELTPPQMELLLRVWKENLVVVKDSYSSNPNPAWYVAAEPSNNIRARSSSEASARVLTSPSLSPNARVVTSPSHSPSTRARGSPLHSPDRPPTTPSQSPNARVLSSPVLSATPYSPLTLPRAAPKSPLQPVVLDSGSNVSAPDGKVETEGEYNEAASGAVPDVMSNGGHEDTLGALRARGSIRYSYTYCAGIFGKVVSSPPLPSVGDTHSDYTVSYERMFGTQNFGRPSDRKSQESLQHHRVCYAALFSSGVVVESTCVEKPVDGQASGWMVANVGDVGAHVPCRSGGALFPVFLLSGKATSSDDTGDNRSFWNKSTSLEDLNAIRIVCVSDSCGNRDCYQLDVGEVMFCLRPEMLTYLLGVFDWGVFQEMYRTSSEDSTGINSNSNSVATQTAAKSTGDSPSGIELSARVEGFVLWVVGRTHVCSDSPVPALLVSFALEAFLSDVSARRSFLFTPRPLDKVPSEDLSSGVQVSHVNVSCTPFKDAPLPLCLYLESAVTPFSVSKPIWLISSGDYDRLQSWHSWLNIFKEPWDIVGSVGACQSNRVHTLRDVTRGTNDSTAHAMGSELEVNVEAAPESGFVPEEKEPMQGAWMENFYAIPPFLSDVSISVKCSVTDGEERGEISDSISSKGVVRDQHIFVDVASEPVWVEISYVGVQVGANLGLAYKSVGDDFASALANFNAIYPNVHQSNAPTQDDSVSVSFFQKSPQRDAEETTMPSESVVLYLTAELPEVGLGILEDSSLQPSPLLRFSGGLSIAGECPLNYKGSVPSPDSSSDFAHALHKLRLESRVAVSGDYFNDRILSWEPLLEPWVFSSTLRRLVESPTRPQWQLAVSSTDVANVNVTHALLKLLSDAVQSWTSEWDIHNDLWNQTSSADATGPSASPPAASPASESGGIGVNRSSVHTVGYYKPFHIRNETGTAVSYEVTGGYYGQCIRVPNGTEVPIFLHPDFHGPTRGGMEEPLSPRPDGVVGRRAGLPTLPRQITKIWLERRREGRDRRRRRRSSQFCIDDIRSLKLHIHVPGVGVARGVQFTQAGLRCYPLTPVSTFESASNLCNQDGSSFSGLGVGVGVNARGFRAGSSTPLSSPSSTSQGPWVIGEVVKRGNSGLKVLVLQSTSTVRNAMSVNTNVSLDGKSFGVAAGATLPVPPEFLSSPVYLQIRPASQIGSFSGVEPASNDWGDTYFDDHVSYDDTFSRNDRSGHPPTSHHFTSSKTLSTPPTLQAAAQYQWHDGRPLVLPPPTVSSSASTSSSTPPISGSSSTNYGTPYKRIIVCRPATSQALHTPFGLFQRHPFHAVVHFETMLLPIDNTSSATSATSSSTKRPMGAVEETQWLLVRRCVLRPPLVIDNLLATSLSDVRFRDSCIQTPSLRIPCGETAEIHDLDVDDSITLSLRIPHFRSARSIPLNVVRTSSGELCNSSQRISVYDAHQRRLDLSLEIKEDTLERSFSNYSSTAPAGPTPPRDSTPRKKKPKRSTYTGGTIVVTVFCQYWFVNRTLGLPLELREHLSTMERILIERQRRENPDEIGMVAGQTGRTGFGFAGRETKEPKRWKRGPAFHCMSISTGAASPPERHSEDGEDTSSLERTSHKSREILVSSSIDTSAISRPSGGIGRGTGSVLMRLPVVESNVRNYDPHTQLSRDQKSSSYVLKRPALTPLHVRSTADGATRLPRSSSAGRICTGDGGVYLDSLFCGTDGATDGDRVGLASLVDDASIISSLDETDIGSDDDSLLDREDSWEDGIDKGPGVETNKRRRQDSREEAANGFHTDRADEWVSRPLPLMFSISEENTSGAPDSADVRMCMRTSRSSWSTPFPIDSLGLTGAIRVEEVSEEGERDVSPRRLFMFGVSIDLAPGKFCRTTVITFTPRYILSSRLRKPILIKQQSTDAVDCLDAGSNVAFHWPDSTQKTHLCFRFEEYGWDWSGGVSLDQVGEHNLRIRNSYTRQSFILSVAVRSVRATCFALLEAVYEDTFPPYRIENFTLDTVRFHQYGVRDLLDELRPYQSCSYGWDDPSMPHKVVIKFSGAKKPNAYDLDEPRDFGTVSLAASSQRGPRMYRVFVRADGPTRVLSIVDAKVHAAGSVYSPPESSTATWNFMQAELPNFFRARGSEAGASPDVVLRELCHLHPYASTISGNGESQPYHSRWRFHGSSYSSSATTSPSTPASGNATGRLQRRPPLLEVGIALAGVGLSLIDGAPTELCYASASRISLSLSHTVSEQWDATVTVEHVQVDNQLFGVPNEFSVVVSPSVAGSSSTPFLRAAVSVHPSTPNLIHLRGFRLYLQPVDIMMEPDLVCRLLWLYTDVAMALRVRDGSEPTPSQVIDTVITAPFSASPLFETTPRRSQKLYFETFHVGAISATVTFKSSSRLLELWSSHSALMPISSALVAAVANVENAFIRLEPLSLQHPFVTQWVLISMIIKHYRWEFLRRFTGILSVIGSADFLGSPVSQITRLYSGLVDHFSEAALGLGQGNVVLMCTGVMRGALSLVHNSAYGVSDFLSKISGSLAKGLRPLSLDNEPYFRGPRETSLGKELAPLGLPSSEWQARALRGGTGALGVAESIVSAVRGLYLHPWQYGQHEGAKGVLKGLGVGLVGAVVKPVAGMLDLTSSTFGVIRDVAADVRSMIASGPLLRRRVRPPRGFGHGAALEVFTYEDALCGMALLSELGRAGENYLTYTSVDEASGVLVTTERILFIIFPDRITKNTPKSLSQDPFLLPHYSLSRLSDLLPSITSGNPPSFRHGYSLPPTAAASKGIRALALPGPVPGRAPLALSPTAPAVPRLRPAGLLAASSPVRGSGGGVASTSMRNGSGGSTGGTGGTGGTGSSSSGGVGSSGVGGIQGGSTSFSGPLRTPTLAPGTHTLSLIPGEGGVLVRERIPLSFLLPPREPAPQSASVPPSPPLGGSQNKVGRAEAPTLGQFASDDQSSIMGSSSFSTTTPVGRSAPGVVGSSTAARRRSTLPATSPLLSSSSSRLAQKPTQVLTSLSLSSPYAPRQHPSHSATGLSPHLHPHQHQHPPPPTGLTPRLLGRVICDWQIMLVDVLSVSQQGKDVVVVFLPGQLDAALLGCPANPIAQHVITCAELNQALWLLKQIDSLRSPTVFESL